METYTEGTQFTHARGKKTAVLAAAFLAALSTISAAQTGGPSPAAKAPQTSGIPESIQLKINGTTYVYNLSESDKENLAAHPPRHHKIKKVFSCHGLQGGLTCF
jgi:ABC-type phosphate transport system substrate-binding protein